MPPYNPVAEREKLWYLKYNDPQLNRALVNGPPQGIYPMPFETFEPVYKLFTEYLGGTHKPHFSIKHAPVPMHVHSIHHIVWNFRGFVQVEKTGSWSSVAKHLGLTLNTPDPTLSTCHSLSNAFKTSGLAQFEAWYSISICAGKFVPVNGKEIPYLLPDPSAHDVFAELVHIWCDYSAVMTPTEPDPGVALAEYLRKTLTSCSQSPLNKPDPMVDKFKALSSGLSGMRLHLRQVQAILEMGSSTPEALSLQGIPDSTIAFVQEHGEAIREIQARHVASLSGGNAAPSDPSEEVVQTGASS